MAYIIAAKDLTEGATVMAVCQTRTQAASLVVKFHNEGLEEIQTVDSAGQSIAEDELGEAEAGDEKPTSSAER